MCQTQEQAKCEHSGDLCEKFLQKEKIDRIPTMFILREDLDSWGRDPGE